MTPSRQSSGRVLIGPLEGARSRLPKIHSALCSKTLSAFSGDPEAEFQNITLQQSKSFVNLQIVRITAPLA